MDLGQLRAAVFAWLFARSQGGTVVVSSENPSALDDLEWLGIEHDQKAAPIDSRHALEKGQELISQGRAYPCFCSVAELREMPVNPAGFPESVFYDQRCHRLSPNDRSALEKLGRRSRIRIVAPAESPKVPGAEPIPVRADFAVVELDGTPTALFSSVLAASDAGATDLLVDGSRAHELAHWWVVAEALGWTGPRLHLIAPWLLPDGTAIGQRPDGTTIAELRARGLLPSTLLRAAASAGWDPGDATDLAAMAARFRIEQISTESPRLDLAALLQLNGDILRAMDRSLLIAAVGEHLDRKGFPFSERDPAWKARFVDAVAAEMTTLADAEEWAVVLLASTADYDREVSRTLRSAETQTLIAEFTRAMQGIDGDEGDPRSWRGVLSDFRRDSAAPGRALVTLRLVLTGQREGPALPSVLALLGVEGCRQRLEKARRYAHT